MAKALITGSSGFIGFHLSKLLIDSGYEVLGYDVLSDYYDVELKIARQNQLLTMQNFKNVNADIEDYEALKECFTEYQPQVVIHLAAQAGVRYSIQNPRKYIDTNVIGTFNVLECAKIVGAEHTLMASTSSIYGANETMPYSEEHKADAQLTMYSATKKATESMAHAYSNLWKLPITMFRFFTVYGPWGRPDMAFFKFARGIMSEEPIEIYNEGKMRRDFTYVGDIVECIKRLMVVPPRLKQEPAGENLFHSNQDAIPFRIVNIGNSDPVPLLELVDALERALGKKAIRKYLGMQPGDVEATYADVELLTRLIGYTPNTRLDDGIKEFADWYKAYYNWSN